MKKIKIILMVVIILAVAGTAFWFFGNRSVSVNSNDQKQEESKDNSGISPITGEKCVNYNRRPIAVMLSSDSITRPLSAISQADVVVEMPVITGSITRMMAVFGCESPDDIGSVRSARQDFIPLALGLDAIYAHWGGSHFAYDQLNKKIIDNLDAMVNPYDSFYRKPGIPMPHDGFTTMDRLLNAAKKLGYNLENKFVGYPHLAKSESKLQSPNTGGRLSIGYGGEFKVSYAYDPKENTYARYRNNLKETDKNNNNQVKVSVVAVMRAESHMIEPPNYNEVNVQGEGVAKIYQNGEEIQGFWKKTGNYTNSKLTFSDASGKEIEFTPGKIWIEIVEPNTEVKWEVF